MVKSEFECLGLPKMAQELVLHSPVGAEPVVYPWPLSSGGVSVILPVMCSCGKCECIDF